jgi:hypothetical protein
MTLQTQSAKVGEVAFASALCDRDDMIGIPDRLPAPDLPIRQSALARSASQFAQTRELRDAIQTARCTDAFVALEYSLAEMAGVGTEPPFFYAPIGAEGPSALRNLKIAPAADASSVVPFRDRLAVYSTARHCALRTHEPGLKPRTAY